MTTRYCMRELEEVPEADCERAKDGQWVHVTPAQPHFMESGTPAKGPPWQPGVIDPTPTWTDPGGGDVPLPAPAPEQHPQGDR